MRIPRDLKPELIMSIIGTVTGNAWVPQAIVTTTMDLMVPSMGEVPIAEKAPIVEGIVVAKTGLMVEVLLMAGKEMVTEIVPMMGVIFRTMVRRLEAIPAVRLARAVEAIAMAGVVVITTHHSSHDNEVCTL